MDAVVWGLGTALGWGTADFFARYTSRGFGTLIAVAAMLLTSSLILTAVALSKGEALTWHWNSLHFLIVGALGVLVGTSLLYWGLARGPVSLVAPVMASYPAFNLILAVALGIVLSVGQWLLIVMVMAGIITVSRASKDIQSPEQYEPEELTKTIIIAIFAAFAVAVGIASLQTASQVYGEWGTLVFSRWMGAGFAVLACLYFRPSIPKFQPRLILLLVLQGLLDGIAYLSLLFGSHGSGVAIVVVVASCFTVVTLVLARVILKEIVSALQKLGIAMVVGGVAGLAYLGAT